MKIILQNLKSGQIELADIPLLPAKAGHLIIRSTASLISPGTERMLHHFGKSNLYNKARQQPDKVNQVIDKIRTDGLFQTVDAVRTKMDQPLPMGYSNVGRVSEVGEGVAGFKIGDRVVSNGAHAEIVCVPVNLCAKIPGNVADVSATFTVLGAVALQGTRLAHPTLGECFVVIGLGLIGLLAVQILRAHGCRVLGIDLDEGKLGLARQLGAETANPEKGEDPLAIAEHFSRGRGVDGVLISATTKSNEPVHQAAQMCRKRGRIVLVGVTGLKLSRTDFFEKEISFQVSCSYGPGRYDPEYEEKGHDYPIGFVRWTEQRNFEAVLDMLSAGRINVESLISHKFNFEDATEAYRVLMDDPSSLGILLDYQASVNREGEDPLEKKVALDHPEKGGRTTADVVAGFIGAGNYATRVLIPAFKKTGIALKTVSSNGGMSCTYAGRKFGFREATTDAGRLISDDQINMVAISTPHDSHVDLTVEALEKGKHVWVEKPLAIDLVGLKKIRKAYEESRSSGALLMVGFNRRFAPQIQTMKSLLEGVRNPKSFIMTVNSGAIPADHWTQDLQVGGGRIIGEACHFIDLLRFLAGSDFINSDIMIMDSQCGDTASIQLGFADGSLGSVHYFANGSRSFPKERLEVFAGGKILQLDNFRRLRGFGWPGFRKMNLFRQDKGQDACAAAFINAIRDGEPSPIPFDEIMEVSRVTLQLARKVHS